ncbi:pullulanase-associated domain-containing protein [Haploplasma axanthum]|nr:pullulanase-associated domain-containing protein [Haploplasma axanthum]
MKKFLCVLLMAISSVLLVQTVSVRAEGKGNLVIHFQKLDGEYEDVGLNTWGIGADTWAEGIKGPTALSEKTKTDDFGIFWELNDVPVRSEGSMGFQAVGFDNVGQETEVQNWSRKYANHEIQNSVVVADKTVHIYVFEGSNTRTNEEKDADGESTYIVANPDKQGIVIVYYDPTNSYEENLGVHSDGFEASSNAVGWNNPLKIFNNAGKSTVGTFIKAGILYYEDLEKEPVALLYYGDGDNSKKTGDIKPNTEDNAAYIENKKATGQLDFVYVVNKGNNNTTMNNVWVNNPESFRKEAFAFELVGFTPKAQGKEASGTYAIDKRTVIVQTNQELQNLYVLAETDDEKLAADNKIKSWFKIKEITSAVDATTETYGEEIAFESVDYAKGTSNKTLKDFVITLKNDLDINKRYKVFFNDGDLETPREAELELDLDREKPVIRFVSPNFSGVAEADRIIEIAWNKKFDQNKFPIIMVTDNRDGDLTQHFYVPSGEFSKLNTNIEGDYVIMVQVEDAWGNIAQEKFTFRVTRKIK